MIAIVKEAADATKLRVMKSYRIEKNQRQTILFVVLIEKSIWLRQLIAFCVKNKDYKIIIVGDEFTINVREILKRYGSRINYI